MNVRKFWLENANGELYKLTDENTNVFFSNPSGLGITVNFSSIKLANSELINYVDYELGSVDGEILFLNPSREQKYQDYFDFLRFMSLKPILLHYQTPNNNSSYRTLVQMTGLEKTEVQTDGILHCPFSMKRQTLWYGDDLNVVEVKNEVEEGKEYPLNRPYSYGATTLNNISILNNGMIDTPFVIEVEGTVSDMQYSLSQNDIVYGRGKINGTYDYIRIDSDDLEESIELKKGNSVIPNAINYQDLTIGSPNEIFITFLKLRAGENKLNLILGEGFDGMAKISWRNGYLSV